MEGRVLIKLRQMGNLLLFLLLISKEVFKISALMPDCPLYQLHFQKIIGVRPKSEYISESNRLRHDHQTRSNSSTTSRNCYETCKRDPDCFAYVHILDINDCYGYSLLQRTPQYRGVGSEFELIADPNAIFFEKICIDVPENCIEHLWTLTAIPGNSLMHQGRKTIPTLITRRECAERCLFETEFNCLSASFVPSYRNNRERFNDQSREHQPHQKAVGQCILSDKDKMTKPDAFRAAPFEEEYIENQCHPRPIESDFCSYELYADSAFMEACTEAQHVGVSQKECQSLCTRSSTFYCQGATFYKDGDALKSKCLLHSEDIISLGPRSLKLSRNSVYMRRVKCLDIQVVCTKDEMTVKYKPKDFFRGNMYKSFHSKDCSTKGDGNESIALHLPIGSESKEKRCGILRAYEISGNIQRTFITTFVVIQYNPNVQTQGDRLIKVGCILSGPVTLTQDNPYDSRDSNEDGQNAIALDSSFEPTELFLTNFTNDSLPLPKITLQIVDLSQHRETNDVKIGQNLELQITAEYTGQAEKSLRPPNFRATSLLAKTEGTQDFIQLIDENGCPTDIKVFPALERITTHSRNILRAQFQAFKFVGTSTVKFDVNIHFCGEKCPKANCLRSKVKLIGRQRRQLENFRLIKPVYFSTIMGPTTMGRTTFVSANENGNLKVPLTYNLRVRGHDEGDVQNDYYGLDKAFYIYGTVHNKLSSLCFNQSLLVALFIFFLIILVMVIIGCCFCFKKS